MSSQEQTLNLLGALVTISVTGIGLAVGGVIGATVLAGIGLNLGSNLIHGGCSTLKDRWLSSENGLLNHDVQKAVGRAFIKSLSSLEEKYLDLEQTRALKKYERESYKDLFRELKRNAQETLLATIERIRLDPDVKQFLFAVPEADNGQMWKQIVRDKLVASYGSDFQKFLRDNLLKETLFWFGEELKTDNTECNKAWRAFQRMLLEGIYAGVNSIQTNQALLSKDLAKLDAIKRQLEGLQEEINRRLPDELFQKDLETALSEIKATLQTISQTSQRIDHNVVALRKDVNTLLEKHSEVNAYQEPSPAVLETTLTDLRMRMLGAQSSHDLKKVFYEAEALVGRNPHHADTLMLRDEIEAALVRQSEREAEDRTDRAQEVFVSDMQRSRRRLAPLLISLLVIGTVGLFAFLRMERVKDSAVINPSESGGVDGAAQSPPASTSSPSLPRPNFEYRIKQKQQEIEYLTQRIEDLLPHLKREDREAFSRNIITLNLVIAKSQRASGFTPPDEAIFEERLERALDMKLQYLRDFYAFHNKP